MAAAAVIPAVAKPRVVGSFKVPLLAASPLPRSNSLVVVQFPLGGRLKRGGNAASVRLAVRAGSSSIPDYVPDAKFYKVEAILRPWRVSHVSSALLKMGIRGVTVSDVRGFGAQGGSTERQAGSEFSEDKFVAKVKMEIVVCKDQVESVIEKIIDEARTGEIGDGKIFLLPVSDVIRVRTGERGEMAERMTGGRADIISSAVSD
uniref:Nitrogen regulatory protein P-II n=1 Tax=Anthurium amnicola TaxID=1678845 RepID=A0A1D1XWP7_9ARAE